MKSLKLHLKTISLFFGMIVYFPCAFAQLGEIEGDLRISDIRPTIELFDNDSSNNRVEGLIKNIGDELYINSYAGRLHIGARDDGQSILTSQLVVRQGPNRGNVGINYSNPTYPLQIANSDTSSFSVAISENAMRFLKNGAARSAMRHGNGQPLTIENSIIPQDDNEQVFRLDSRVTSGNVLRLMKIVGNGNIGLGAFSGGVPGSSIHLRHRLSNADPREDGVTIENGGSNHHYFTFYVVNSSNDLELYTGQSANPVGRFDAVTGVYSALSDARVKEDVQPIENALDKISALNPVTYHFKHDSIRNNRSAGLLAQELAEVFPELVEKSEKVDVNLVDYTSLLPWLIKGMQEQNERISTLEEEIKLNRAVIKRQSEIIKGLKE